MQHVSFLVGNHLRKTNVFGRSPKKKYTPNAKQLRMLAAPCHAGEIETRAMREDPRSLGDTCCKARQLAFTFAGLPRQQHNAQHWSRSPKLGNWPLHNKYLGLHLRSKSPQGMQLSKRPMLDKLGYTGCSRLLKQRVSLRRKCSLPYLSVNPCCCAAWPKMLKCCRTCLKQHQSSQDFQE